jgi:predicted DCC family thiol-disulfide oxidoreductase YuxK/uncharacterized membrane protein YphA (DoxX/SURF4 family)
MRSWLERLDRHWFAPARLSDLALMRVALVGFQLILLTVPALSERIGACPGCSLRYQQWLTTLDSSQYWPIPALKVLLLPFGWGARPEPMFLHAIWLGAIVTGVCALIGLYTRPALLLFAAANTVLIAHAYSYNETHHTEALMTIGLWALAFGPSGATWALDDVRQRVRCAVAAMRFDPKPTAPAESPYARWPLRLLQWLLVLSYFSGGISKLRNGGLEWFNGYTLAYFIGKDAVDRGSALGMWVSGQLPVLRILSVGAVAVELGFVAAILLPRFTWLFLLAGAGLHAGIYWTQRAPFPQFIVLYVVFAEALRAHGPWRWFAKAKAKAPKWTVIYDGLCPLCIRSMTILDHLDLRTRLRFVDLEREWPAAGALAPGLLQGQARHAMHVISPDGQVSRGFFAFRSLARILPPLWPVLPLLYVPFVAQLGPWIYDQVARSRGTQSCRAETCTV